MKKEYTLNTHKIPEVKNVLQQYFALNNMESVVEEYEGGFLLKAETPRADGGFLYNLACSHHLKCEVRIDQKDDTKICASIGKGAWTETLQTAGFIALFVANAPATSLVFALTAILSVKTGRDALTQKTLPKRTHEFLETYSLYLFILKNVSCLDLLDPATACGKRFRKHHAK